jgi:hypothetical protein
MNVPPFLAHLGNDFELVTGFPPPSELWNAKSSGYGDCSQNPFHLVCGTDRKDAFSPYTENRERMTTGFPGAVQTCD